MTGLSDKKVEVLHAHYQDTYSVIAESIKSRDRNFVLFVALLGAMAFQLASPEESASILADVVKDKLGVASAPGIPYISSLLWLALLLVAIGYFQAVIRLERLYGYIAKLEGKLEKEFGSGLFTREGKAYSAAYAGFLKWVKWLYGAALPLLFLVAVTVKIGTEWASLTAPVVTSLPLVLDTAIYLVLVVSAFKYMRNSRQTA